MVASGVVSRVTQQALRHLVQSVEIGAGSAFIIPWRLRVRSVAIETMTFGERGTSIERFLWVMQKVM